MRASLITITALFALCSTALAAPVPCTKRDDLVRVLDTKYKEKKTSYGLGKENLIEVFVSPKGSFTILVTSPNGTSCIVAAGENWENGETPKEITAL